MKKVLGVLTLLVLLFALSSCLNPPEKMDDGPLKASYNPNTGYINLKWIYDEKYTTFFVYAKGTNDSDYVLLNSLNKKELTFSPPQGLSCSVMVEAEYNGIKSTGITTTVSTPYLSIVGTYKIYVLLDEDIYFTNFVILSQDEGTMYAKFGVDTSYKYFSSANFDGTFEKNKARNILEFKVQTDQNTFLVYKGALSRDQNYDITMGGKLYFQKDSLEATVGYWNTTLSELVPKKQTDKKKKLVDMQELLTYMNSTK